MTAPGMTPELHAKLAQLAAMRIVRFGEDGAALTSALASSLRVAANWPEADARACAAQVAAEAATWGRGELAEHFRAWEKATGGLVRGLEEQQITERQRDVRARREANRREDAREAEAAAAAEGPVVIRSGEWLTAQQFAPVEFAVPRMIPEGVTILGGPPKGGKSWLALAVGLSLAAGGKILGALDNGPARPVLYLALEDSDRRMKQRCAELGYHHIPAAFEYITQCRPGRVLEVIGAWLEKHQGGRPLVIIDTWGKISMPAAKGETIYERDYRLGGQVEKLAKGNPGAAIWINHHVRKERATDWIELISGTNAVTGFADTVAVLVRKRGEDTGRLHITGRDVEEETYQLAAFPHWELDGGDLNAAAVAARAAAERENLGERSAQLLDEITRRRQMSTKEAADLTGMTTDQASVYLGRLAKAGKIDKDGRGQWKSRILLPPVGSVGSVGITNNPNRTNSGYARAREVVDWQRLSDMAGDGD
jgi:hypothetical protein